LAWTNSRGDGLYQKGLGVFARSSSDVFFLPRASPPFFMVEHLARFIPFHDPPFPEWPKRMTQLFTISRFAFCIFGGFWFHVPLFFFFPRALHHFFTLALRLIHGPTTTIFPCSFPPPPQYNRRSRVPRRPAAVFGAFVF